MDAVSDTITACLGSIFLALFLMALAANWQAVLDYVINGYNLMSQYWDEN